MSVRRFKEWDTDTWRAFVARLTYKPGVTLEIIDPRLSYSALAIRINRLLPDATGREPRDIPVILQEGLPLVCCKREAIEVIRCVIEKAERHEIDEWLKLDGQCVADPHAAQASPATNKGVIT